MKTFLFALLFVFFGIASSGDRVEFVGSIVPMGDGLEFSLTVQTGCKTRHRDAPLFYGAILYTGEYFGNKHVTGCWERLPDQSIRVYIDEWRPEYQVTTVPASAEKVTPLTTDKPMRSVAKDRAS